MRPGWDCCGWWVDKARTSGRHAEVRWDSDQVCAKGSTQGGPAQVGVGGSRLGLREGAGRGSTPDPLHPDQGRMQYPRVAEGYGRLRGIPRSGGGDSPGRAAVGTSDTWWGPRTPHRDLGHAIPCPTSPVDVRDPHNWLARTRSASFCEIRAKSGTASSRRNLACWVSRRSLVDQCSGNPLPRTEIHH